MSWAKFDDRYHESRKIRKAWRTNAHAVALHAMAITYCAGHDTDGLIDEDWLIVKLPKPAERKRVVGVLVECGLFDYIAPGETVTVSDRDGNELTLRADFDGEPAWIVHDYLDYNDSSVQREVARTWDRKRKDLERDRELVTAIRMRDGDRCRYCAKRVSWRDRRSADGGTYDHVKPRGDNSLLNVVVACRGCNSSKGARTPEQAGMVLLPPPDLAGSSPDLAAGLNGSSRISTLPDPTRPDPTDEVRDAAFEIDALEALLQDQPQGSTGR